MSPSARVFRAGERSVERRPGFRSLQSFNFGDHVVPGRDGLGALMVFNVDQVDDGTGIPLHPHRGVEILSVMLEGVMHHRDNLGNALTIRAGDVKVMHAGTGLQHGGVCEGTTRFLQIWLRAEQAGPPKVEVVSSSPGLPDGRWHTLVGEGTATPLRTRAWAHRARVTPGARLSLPATASGHRLVFVMPLSGSVRIGEVELFEGDSFEALLEGPTDLVSPASADVFVIEQHVKESP
jgi:redox-sensitive bicupin YhaK (pirin superfamily)